MRRVLIFLLTALTCFTQISFAATENYEYDASNIKIPLSDEEWSVFTAEDRSYWSENLDAESFNSVYSIFDSNDRIKFVAIDRDGSCYWTFMPFGDRSQPEEFSSYSDSEWKSFRLSFLSDDEIKDAFGDYVGSPGFDVEFDSIESYNNQKYLLIAGRVTNNGQTLPIFSFLTIVNGYTYTFNLYLLTEDEEQNTNAVSKMADILSSIDYKSTGEAASDSSATSDGEEADTAANENADRANSLITALMAVIPVAIVLVIIKVALSRRKNPQLKDNNKDSDETADSSVEKQSEPVTADGIRNTTYEDLKALKELYESGVISEEEYSAKKKQILGL